MSFCLQKWPNLWERENKSSIGTTSIELLTVQNPTNSIFKSSLKNWQPAKIVHRLLDVTWRTQKSNMANSFLNFKDKKHYYLRNYQGWNTEIKNCKAAQQLGVSNTLKTSTKWDKDTATKGSFTVAKTKNSGSSSWHDKVTTMNCMADT